MMTIHRPQAPYFNWYATGKSPIPRYHLDQPIIDAQLDALLAVGADGISLSPLLMENAASLGMSDEFIDWRDGALTPQMEQNLELLLRRIKSKGFNFVQIAPQFYGPNDFRKWPVFNEGRYQHNWNFIFRLWNFLRQIRLPFLIDACTEFNGPYSAAYTKRLWDDATTEFYPGGAPVWDVTMSFIPSASYADVADAFQGNVPMYLVPHPYTNEGDSFYNLLKGIQAGLAAVGIPPSTWIFGETDTLRSADVKYTEQCQRFIVDYHQPIERVCPWQVGVSSPPNVNVDPACVPPVVSEAWI